MRELRPKAPPTGAASQPDKRGNQMDEATGKAPWIATPIAETHGVVPVLVGLDCGSGLLTTRAVCYRVSFPEG